MKHLLFIAVLALTLSGYGQDVISEKELSELIHLKAFEKTISGNKVITYHPTIYNKTIPKEFRRRFEYILLNYSHIDEASYTKRYPDTLKIQAAYVTSLLKNQKTLQTISLCYNAIVNRNVRKEFSSSEKEVKQIASQFFAVKGFLGKDQLDWRVCISLENKDAHQPIKDWILEAFCFEAIFENLRSPEEDKRKFMENFLSYIATTEEQLPTQQPEKFIEKSKAVIISKMYQDTALRSMILSYYKNNQTNVPFTIKL